MSPASYQTAPPRDVCRFDRPFLELPACLGPARGPAAVCLRAGNGTRTRDPNLGKVVLYQLSYSRVRTSFKLNRVSGQTETRPHLPLLLSAVSSGKEWRRGGSNP